MKRRLTLLFLVLGLAVPAAAQTVYALRERGRPIFVTDPPLPNPNQTLDLVQFTGTVTAGYVDVTSLMSLPLDAHIAAFDATGRRVYLTLPAKNNLYIADLEAKTHLRGRVRRLGPDSPGEHRRAEGNGVVRVHPRRLRRGGRGAGRPAEAARRPGSLTDAARAQAKATHAPCLMPHAPPLGTQHSALSTNVTHTPR